MHPRAEEFAARAQDRHDFDPDVEEFPGGTKTAADAADAVGCDVAQIASSIVISTGDGLAVVVTSGANRVDLDRVAALLDVESASMADPDEVRETVGWAIGGVPPFCHDAALPVLLDERLLEFETVWAAAGTPAAIFQIEPKTLRVLSGGKPADVAE